jgi:putative ABC transport system ATP-binding protein
MPDNAVIAIDRLRFSWPAAPTPCLDIRRFSIDTGERVFLFGPSGTGKSTLLGLLGGVLTPQSGKVRVLHHDLATIASGARDRFRVDHIGFIFQQFNLIPYLSVLDNVLLPCRFSTQRHRKAIAGGRSLQEEGNRLLSELDIDPALQSRPVTALSVGQQQRVAAARALIGQPEIIIADEPTSSLDAERQESFLDLLLCECQTSQATVLFVSHDRRLARHFDREISLGDINHAAVAEADQ